MNIYMPKAEFEKLPFRDELVNEPIDGAYFRDRHKSRDIVQAVVSDSTGRLWAWWRFRVDFD